MTCYHIAIVKKISPSSLGFSRLPTRDGQFYYNGWIRYLSRRFLVASLKSKQMQSHHLNHVNVANMTTVCLRWSLARDIIIRLILLHRSRQEPSILQDRRDETCSNSRGTNRKNPASHRGGSRDDGTCAGTGSAYCSQQLRSQNDRYDII